MKQYRYRRVQALAAVLLCSSVVLAEDVDKQLFLVRDEGRIVAVNAGTGQFFDLDLSAKERVERRIEKDAVAIVVTNQRFAAISDLPTGWASLRRKAGERLLDVEAADRSAVLVTTDRILSFSGSSGAWAQRRR